jgi:predicted DsbA family dithiol-disulfide isomerase
VPTGSNSHRRTYLAFLRLSKALSTYRASHPDARAEFTLRLAPYQLYPQASKEGTDKHAWYVTEKYGGSEEKMEMYTKYMSALGAKEGIRFDWNGVMANSLDALRILLYVQDTRGADAAARCLDALYRQYFAEQRSPAAEETLVEACRAAGLEGDEAERVVRDGEVGLEEVKEGIRENRGNGVDSVPYVVFEGRKRDFTLVGAKEVADYIKTLEAVAKEC